MRMIQPSPLQLLENRIAKFSWQKLCALSTFCAEIAIKNVEIYWTAIGQPKELRFKNELDENFWRQLEERNIRFSYDYEKIKETLLALISDLAEYPEGNEIKPPLGAELVQESIYLYIVNCSFYAEVGRPSQLLTVLNNCISQKIDLQYNEGLEMNFRKIKPNLLSAIYDFPVYKHAIIDLDWAISLLEKGEDVWADEYSLNSMKIYAKNIETFIMNSPRSV